jgi:tetratricopeptide (TPR) repeat protein
MDFRLVIETDSSKRVISFSLSDKNGVILSNSQIKLDDLSPALLQGLFDTRAYIERYSHPSLTHVGGKSAESILTALGTSLGLDILGKEIMGILSGSHPRTLFIQLPTIKKGDSLAAAAARIPWEIARISPTEKSLFEQNVVVRTILSGMSPVEVNEYEYDPLRILFVFAEMPGSRLLSMRLEREQLLNLFFESILPQRNVEVDILCYGFSRQRLENLIRSKGGYNIIHWSGHGNYNRLELHGSQGNPDPLSGQDFVELIIKSGGIIPQLVFLSSCLSGAFENLHDWQDFHAAMSGTRVAQLLIKSRETSDPIHIQPGYTGVALELIRGGIPQVIAMRYEIGDDYARELAQSFYRYLLVDPAHYTAEIALSLARHELAQASANAACGRRECPMDDIAHNFHPVDHVTPVFFGDTQLGFRIKSGVSPQLQCRNPHPQPLLPGNSGDFNVPDIFVGRSKELSLIVNKWLPDGTLSLIFIQGLGGMGKTTLAAEIIHLWHTYFDFVFVFQLKNRPLELEEFLRILDLKLRANSSNYREMINASPNAAVYLPIEGSFSDSKRYDQLFSNIVKVMHKEKILLIIDNFETNLEIESSQQNYNCKNPYWDSFIRKLVDGLPPRGSRLVITSRRMLKSLVSNNNTLWLLLGPLSIDEVYLFIQYNDSLNKLYSSGLFGQLLINRMVIISRGHPLILKHLSAFANEPQRLNDLLTQMESKDGWQTHPDLFTVHLSETDCDREREYLEQATCSSIDTLIQGLSLQARRLLWIITRSNEPVSKELLDSIWMNQSDSEETISRRKGVSGLSLGVSSTGKHTHSYSKKIIPVIDPLILELQYAGVLHQESEGIYSHQEIVRDRISIWISNHTKECSDLIEQQIWHAYATRYEVMYYSVVTSGFNGAMEAADEIIKRAIKYYVLSCDFVSVGECASRAVMTIANPMMITDLIEEIREVADQVPEGSARWRIFGSLGGLLAKIGDHNRANELFILALGEAEKYENWVDIGIISQNWATTFEERGDLPNARKVFSHGRDYQLKSGLPPIYIVMSEVECLRIDIYQGKSLESWPKIEKRLIKMRNWWQQHRSGHRISEAPDSLIIGPGLVSCLNVAAQAKMAMKLYNDCLELIDEMIQTQQDFGEGDLQLARSHLDRCQALIELNRLDEAQIQIETCLDVFREYDSLDFQVQALNALSIVWYKTGDYPQAIAILQQGLAICNALQNPVDRAKFHSNLSRMYHHINNPEENARHMLASIIYNTITSHLQDLALDLRNREIDIKHFNRFQINCILPQLNELIALREFYSLAQFLIQNHVNLEELQAGLDLLEKDVRKDV